MTIYHNHHIIPKHAGGTDDPDNITKLTIEEHAEAHKKLWEERGLLGDKIAWLALSNQIDRGEIQKELGKLVGKSNIGRKLSKEHIDRIRQCNTGKPSPRKGIPLSEETRLKMSKSRMGRIVTQETRDKISKSKRGLT